MYVVVIIIRLTARTCEVLDSRDIEPSRLWSAIVNRENRQITGHSIKKTDREWVSMMVQSEET